MAASSDDGNAMRDDADQLKSVALDAERLMALHGLAGWSFRFNDAPRGAASCKYRIRVIEMSRQYALRAPDGERTDTLLHEIAHALVGRKHRHDSVWQATARAIGCVGKRCRNVDATRPKYFATCPKCNWSEGRNLRLKKAVCKECGAAVRYLTESEAAWRAANTSRA